MKKILVAVDGSENSIRAVSYALSLKKAGSQVQVTVLYVGPSCYDLFSEPGICACIQQKELDKEIEIRANKIFEKIDRCFMQKGTSIEKAIIRGNVASAICRFAQEGGYDTVVIGSHGYENEKESALTIGSVSFKLLNICQCPVTIVK